MGAKCHGRFHWAVNQNYLRKSGTTFGRFLQTDIIGLRWLYAYTMSPSLVLSFAVIAAVLTRAQQQILGKYFHRASTVKTN